MLLTRFWRRHTDRVYLCNGVTAVTVYAYIETVMGPATEHERPAKRVKRDEVGGSVPTPSTTKHGDEDSEEEAGFVNNGAAHGSDLYLDTVRIA